MNRTQLNTYIDNNVTNKTVADSLTPTDEGNALKAVADYIDQEILTVTPISKVSKTIITSAQVLDIFSTPINIVPTPDAGILIVPLFIDIIIDFNTTTYSDVGGAWKVTFGSSNVSLTTITSYLGSATFDKETMQTIFFSATTSSGTFIGQPLKLTTSGNNPIGGDSGVTIYVTYIEVTI